jgi:hypothetical protein
MSNGDDPCQSIVDAIANLQQMLLDLQAQEQDATGPELSILRWRIMHTNQQIQIEEQTLQRCRKNPPPPPPPPFIVNFSGTAEVHTDSSQAPGPFDGPFAVSLAFNQDHTIFVLSGFQTTVQGIAISQTSGGRGEFNPATGSTQLELGLNVKLPIPGDSDATLDFFSPHQLTTEQPPTVGPFSPQGNRLSRATGSIALAGASTFSNNVFANGTNVMVLLIGTFMPVP